MAKTLSVDHWFSTKDDSGSEDHLIMCGSIFDSHNCSWCLVSRSQWGSQSPATHWTAFHSKELPNPKYPYCQGPETLEEIPRAFLCVLSLPCPFLSFIKATPPGVMIVPGQPLQFTPHNFSLCKPVLQSEPQGCPFWWRAGVGEALTELLMDSREKPMSGICGEEEYGNPQSLVMGTDSAPC